MFSVSVKFVDNTKAVKAAAEKGAFTSFRHAAASIRKVAQASIDRSSEPSAPGEPPHTRGRGGHNIRTAIVFHATKEDAVVGPRASIVGQSASAHEHGGFYRGQVFEQRPFMFPALQESLPRFLAAWEGSIGG